MKFQSLQIITSTDRIINQIQQNIKTTISFLLNDVFNYANNIQNIQLQPGLNSINHKLNRKLTGYIITRQKQPANIYDKQDTNPSPELTLHLQSDSATTIDIRVF